MSTAKKLQSTLAGSGGAGEYVDDLFSTYLYEGTGSSQTITNGIDLENEGGMVWFKDRVDGTRNHAVFDSERGINSSGSNEGVLNTNNTNPVGFANFISSFNSDGFTIAGNNYFNLSGHASVSWTFRKAPKFFDVVTYTGDDDSSGRTISHNLGSAPGCIIIKNTTNSADWWVWHRGTASDGRLLLNTTDTFLATSWVDSVTDSSFTINTANRTLNEVSNNYVAYLFAHNDGDGGFGEKGNQDIIKCGSYTGNGSTDGPEIDLGFEPQWILHKPVDVNSTYWHVIDSMRGWPTKDAGSAATIRPSESDAESGSLGNAIYPLPTGFKINDNFTSINQSGKTYIYIAIRRPHKPAESGDEVFEPFGYQGTGESNKVWETGINTDMMLLKNRPSNYETNWHLCDRVRGFGSRLQPNNTSQEFYESDKIKDVWNTSFNSGESPSSWNYASATFIAYQFRRAPNFFDVVAYEGDSVAGHAVNHNLGVAPEMMIVKNRTRSGTSFMYYHKDAGNTKALWPEVFNPPQFATSAAWWNNTSPTESVFTVGSGTNVNYSTDNIIAYLFASQDGISKVGSYTGNGTSQTIDCGFSTGARFVLIFREDAPSHVHVFDTERGIVAGNDPRLELTTTDAEDTATDYVDPVSSGFAVTSSSEVNASGGTFLYLAIA